MMKKRIFIATIFVSFLMLSMASQALAKQNDDKVEKPKFKSATSTAALVKGINQTYLACRKTAKVKYDTTFKTANEVYQKALTDAREKHKAAITAAKALTDKQARVNAVKAANKTYNEAKAKARATWLAAKKAAREQNKTDLKKCIDDKKQAKENLNK